MDLLQTKRADSMSLFEAVTAANPEPMPDIDGKHEKFMEWKKSEDYKKLSYQEKVSVTKEFFKQPDIVELADKKWLAQLKNYNAIQWLVFYKKNYIQNDQESRAIEIKLQQFIGFIGDQNNVFPALRVNILVLGLKSLSEIDRAEWGE